MNQPKIIQLAIGKPKSFERNGAEYISAIGKEPVKEVFLTAEGLAGDGIANPEFHGGPDRALCLYPFEHYPKWEEEFGVQLYPPVFGENITVAGMRESDVFIGDIFKIGGAVVQITQGRVPCSTISKFNSIDPFLKRVYKTCLTGYFFRVLEEGSITQDSKIVLQQRSNQEITVFSAARAILHKSGDTDFIERLAGLPELAEEWRYKAEKILEEKLAKK
ncbi:MOSC domain-containing protein [Neobacillus piezotolerans]|uniref:MOSC domain-containing protein n=1 Tax=Neobacillus piezotolerans TaxID=2259171 RepID=A0A3D8GPQ6_9BACI|nr:MOSC domain-containing protein [Neobacillus piezotolerans]RDU36473.1 MOSC domain-containing protein [Neobacillus piezotolerans]